MPNTPIVGSVDDRGNIWEIADTKARQDIANLATVATSGDYNDLSNKPVIDSAVSDSSTNAVENQAIANFVNSSIATETAHFVGTYNSLADLEAHADYPYTITNNDYGFVISTDQEGNTIYNRYKYNDEAQAWEFEYALNNSSFTAVQWAAINSGATSTNIGQIATNTNDISNLQNTKVDKVQGKGLSTNDFTDALKDKLDGIESGATKTIIDSALSTSSTNPVENKVVTTNLNTKYNTADMVPTTWEEWEAMGDEKYSDGKLYFIPGEDDPQPYQIYGFHVDPTESDPDACVTYLEDAIGMTPASMGATEFSYGTWGNAFFMPKPCMVKYDGTVDYYLDPNDYTKKADGTASDVADPNYGGNAMMQWPKIWFKFEEGLTEGEGYFYCSNKKVDNSYNCYCNIDSQNNEIDYFYTAIYIGTTANSKMRSISGVQTNAANGCGTQTGDTQQANAVANNTTANIEWFMEVWSDRMLINALLILMSKSLNSQAKFGNGLVTGSQTAADAYITGTLNTKGLFWGDTTNQNQGVKVFGMENWWGHKWHRTFGLVGTSTGYLYKMTYNNYDGSTATSYNSTGSGYLTATNKSGTALVQPSDNYLNKCNYGQYGYLPIVTSSGSTSTYYSDYYYKGASFLRVGGGTGYALDAGSSYFNLNYTFSYSNWLISASLSLKPLAPA